MKIILFKITKNDIFFKRNNIIRSIKYTFAEKICFASVFEDLNGKCLLKYYCKLKI